MLNFKIAVFCCCAVFWLKTSFGQQPTENSFVTFAWNEATGTHTAERLRVASTAKESRLAEQDPEGNWSDSVNGFQLSVRFEKSLFRVGEPIVADTFLRNVSNVALSHPFVSGAGFDSKLCRLLITRDGRTPVEPTTRPHLMSVRSNELHPKAQWKCSVRLDEMFRLDSPGTYFITGVTSVGHPPTEIRTRNAMIQIVSADSPVKTDNSSASLPGIAGAHSEPKTTAETAASENTGGLRSRVRQTRQNAANQNLPETLGAVSAAEVVPRFSGIQRIGIALLSVLIALVLIIIWRASRRKGSALD